MNVLDLFSGIGGFSLGLERAGMRTVAFCEIDPFCRRVLARHWPRVPIFLDVRTLCRRLWMNEPENEDGYVECKIHRGCDFGHCDCIGTDQFFDEVGAIDVICGGFPCQDISVAGKGAGINGERSGLWSEYARIVGELRPRYVIVENVSALLGRGLERVLGDLAALGYDAEWHCIPASAVGAPHRRDRVWIVARDANRGGCPQQWWTVSIPAQLAAAECAGASVADAERGRLQGRDVERIWPPAIIPPALGRHCGEREFGSPWRIEPDVGRVAYGLPAQVDRLSALGNAVVPQISEIIGRAIMSHLTPPPP